MLTHDRHAEALGVLERALELADDPELGVTLAMAAADAEQRLGLHDEAANRLDELLVRLATDYWRRQQILERRLDLTSDADERDEMLARMASQVAERPADEAAADLAHALGL